MRGIAASQALDGHSAASSLLLTHAPPLLQLDEASRGSVASSEKAGRGAGSTAGSAATGESGGASRVRQPGASQGRGRGREVARRGSLLGLAQASAKDDEGQGFGAWKVFIAKVARNFGRLMILYISRGYSVDMCFVWSTARRGLTVWRIWGGDGSHEASLRCLALVHLILLARQNHVLLPGSL